MKKTFLTMIFVLIMCVSASAAPMLFDVYGDYISKSTETYLGTIGAFSGDIGHIDNYNYFSASGHPVNGPTPTTQEAFFWFYYAPNNTLSFNLIQGKDNSTPDYWNYTNWEFQFNTGGYNVLLTDDTGEPMGFTDNGGGNMSAGFQYIHNSDGGVVGVNNPVCGNDWSIRVAPGDLGDINLITASSFGSSDLAIWGAAKCEQYDFYTFRPNCVIPEPGTMILLGMGLLAGAGIIRRKK
jgi:PEP-CTERM motif